MSVWHMSYVVCDDCHSPADLGDDYKEARGMAAAAGFKRIKRGDEMVDVCRSCLADPDWQAKA